jgi:hypothetical protein
VGETLMQINYTVEGSDTLPSIAEACGHSGEWTSILESAPWLQGLDYLAVPPGSSVLLPDGWEPRSYAEEGRAIQTEELERSRAHARTREPQHERDRD